MSDRLTAPGRSAVAPLLLFAVSGALGLAYQVLWSRSLLDRIGASAHSHATVLAAFMGGLALGNALLGRWADRSRNPLRLFALLEALIGLYGLAYAPLQALAGRDPALAGALLIPPTLLMGGTYPAILRHITARLPAAGRRASQAYAVNALGAAAGSLLTAFVLLPSLGLRGSLQLVATTNLIVAAVAGLWSIRGTAKLAAAASPDDAAPPRSAEGEPEDAAPARPASSLWLLALMAAGFLAFSLEMAWTRYLSLVIGSSTDSFAVMLAAFITGIGLGSALLARLEHRIADPLAAWGWAQLGAATALLLPLPALQYLPWVLLKVLDLFAPSDGGFVLYTGAKLVLCLLLMLPGALALGVTLPLAIKGLARSLDSLGSLAGRCYAWNTAGNVAGAVMTGLWLLPLLGIERLFRIAALGSGLLGFALLFARLPGEAGARRRRLAASLAVVLALVGLHVAAPRWNGGWFTVSPFRRLTASPSFAEARDFVKTVSVRLLLDDPAAHILVGDSPRPDGFERTLFVNGKPDATAFGDMSTQRLLAHVPLTLLPDAREVLVVGLASGTTAGSALTHPIEHLVVAEIVRAMPLATSLFEDWNGQPLADPRTRLVLADARAHLSEPGTRYDLIVSEPSNPWMAGVASLFTREFYALAASRLSDDGAFAQWLHVYELEDESFLAVVASFRAAFPQVTAFQTRSGDLLLIGTRRTLRPDWERVLERSERPAVARDLERIGVPDLASLLALQKLSPASVDLLLSGDPVPNTDDNRLLEYRAPVALFTGHRVRLADELDEREIASPALLLSDYLERHAARVRPRNLVRMMSRQSVATQTVREAWNALLLQRSPELVDDPRVAVSLLPELIVNAPPSAAELRDRVRGLVAEGHLSLAESVAAFWAPLILTRAALEPEEAAAWLETLAPGAGQSEDLRGLRIQVLMASRALDAAREALLDWLEQPAPPPRDWAERSACLIDARDLCQAVRARYESVSPLAGDSDDDPAVTP